ncbi:MAG: HIT family protein [Nanoarchaeota archaeon]
MACEFCDGLKEKKLKVLYEDNFAAIILSSQATKGHIRVYPKAHLTKIDELQNEIVEHAFFLANYAAASLFETLGAHGTNILLDESSGHLHIDIIERKQDDGMNLLWKPKQLGQDEMEKIAKKIKDAIIIGEDTPAEVIAEAAPVLKELKKTEGKNYLLKSLDRIP